MGKSNWINYFLVMVAYAIGIMLAFWNVILTWQYVIAGSDSSINKMIGLLVSISIVPIEQLIFNWCFEPDKAIHMAIPTRMYAPPRNPDPTDKVMSFYYFLQLGLYHVAKVMLPAALILGSIAIYYWDYISTMSSLDYSNESAKHMTTFACVFGTEIGFRVAEELWRWANFGGKPGVAAAFQGLRGRGQQQNFQQPPTAAPRAGSAPRRDSQFDVDKFLS